MEFTNEWSPSKPDWATVIRCPRCRTLIDNEEGKCRDCGLEIRHKTIGLGEVIIYSRDPDFIATAEDIIGQIAGVRNED